jgi:hypothetical protein
MKTREAQPDSNAQWATEEGKRHDEKEQYFGPVSPHTKLHVAIPQHSRRQNHRRKPSHHSGLDAERGNQTSSV